MSRSSQVQSSASHEENEDMVRYQDSSHVSIKFKARQLFELDLITTFAKFHTELELSIERRKLRQRMLLR